MDLKLRRAERRFKQSGAAEDRAALLVERIRTDPSLGVVIALASALGLKAAMIAFPEPYEIPFRPAELSIDRITCGLGIRDIPEGIRQIAPGYEGWIMKFLAIKVVSIDLDRCAPKVILQGPGRLLRLLAISAHPSEIAKHLYSEINESLVVEARVFTAEYLIDLGRLPVLREKADGET